MINTVRKTLKNKRCRKCNEIKPVSGFVPRGTNYRSECKECWSLYHRGGIGIMGMKDKHRFGGNREKAILRDGCRCVSCGMTRLEHKTRYNRDITVNHIDGRGRNSTRPNNCIDNLETLCIPCHVTKDAELRRKLKVKSLAGIL